jgi:hypothetical protein
MNFNNSIFYFTKFITDELQKNLDSFLNYHKFEVLF